MMLFQTKEHDVIYTGDFRASKETIENIECFRNLKNLTIYLDTTFFDKSYMHFPSQAESIEAIISETRKHLGTSPDAKGAN